MPVAVDRLICDDIKTLIVSGSIAKPDNLGPIVAGDLSIDYLPRFEPSDLEQIKILIAPRSRSTSLASRISRTFDLQVQLAVMQSASADSERFLALLDLVSDLDRRLSLASTISGATYRATWVSSECNLYDVASLEQHSVFRSVLTLTFRVTT
jgi:hypothetical protein